MRVHGVLLGLTLAAAQPAAAQSRAVNMADVVTPGAAITAAYESIQRRPGQGADWARFRTLFLPGALMVPNAEQTGGESRIMSVEDFITWVDAHFAETAPIGSASDRGFQEEEIAREMEQYGDVAHAMSAYQKHYWESEENLGRGINSFQLVQLNGRWWIVSIVWDEDYAAGPLPFRYRP